MSLYVSTHLQVSKDFFLRVLILHPYLLNWTEQRRSLFVLITTRRLLIVCLVRFNCAPYYLFLQMTGIKLYIFLELNF